MDLISGVGVSALGHGHPKVIKAIKDQAEKHLHVMVYGEFMQAPQRELAQKLTSLLSSSLDTCYFVNSGAEAIEAALKLAKRVTGRSKLVSCRGAYHGSTHGAMSVSGNEVKKQAFRPLLPDVYFMTFNDFSSLDLIDNNTAGVVIETVQGDAGVRIPSKEWIQALRKRCTDHGVLLILDEIQAGLGRTGKLFAFEHFDIVPDILVLGKALGAGMPIGAIVASKHHMAQFTTDPMLGHITTFGGHPLICAAAKAGLDVLTEDVDLNLINQRGRKLADTLRKHPKVKEVRQIGYYFAIDMETRADVEYVVNYGMAHGYIGFWFLSCPNSFRIAPPLVISDEELSWAEDQLINALNGLR
ncbi:MAG: aspartate aminotransferase family protein [Flavobacteriales bacterium]|nr:aspartate aminotransferase family protein [Flavobacteriales bacterium]